MAKKANKTESLPANNDVLELETEDLGVDGKIEVSESLGKAIKQEVARFDPFEVKMNELREKYSGLTIVDVEDKFGYEDVRLAVADLRSIRTSTAKDKAIIKAPFLAACKTIEEKAAWIIEEVGKIETPLATRKKEIDDERDKIKQQKKQEQEAAFITRTLELTKLGASLNGVSFDLEDISYEAIMVKESDQEVYDTLIKPKYFAIWEVKETARKEQEQKDQDARRQLKEEQDLLETEQKKLKEQQQKLLDDQKFIDDEKKKRQEEENKLATQKREEKISARIRQCYDLGLKFDGSDNHYKGYGVFIPVLDIKVNDDEKWDSEMIKVAEHVKKQKEVAFELEEKNRLGDKRWESLKMFGVPRSIFSDLGAMSADDFTSLHGKHKDIYDKAIAAESEKKAKEKKDQEDLKKQQELELSTDRQKWHMLITALSDVIIPEFKSASYKQKAGFVKDFLDGLK